MRASDKFFIEMRKQAYPKGTRVRLVKMNDPYAKINPGKTGTVSSVDDIGTVFVNWDSGSHLGCAMEEDEFEIINKEDSFI